MKDSQKSASEEQNAVKQAFEGHRFRRLLPVRAIRAAVMMPLTVHDGELKLVFQVRASRINQGGEICFPGGRIEEGETAAEAVIRETVEELKVEADSVEIIAPMFKMIGPGGADIFAYLGILHDYNGSFDESEVESIFEIPLKELLDMNPKSSRSRFVQQPDEDFHFELIPNGRDYPWAAIRREYHFYETEYGIIWGMTGELLRNLLEEIRERGIYGA